MNRMAEIKKGGVMNINPIDQRSVDCALVALKKAGVTGDIAMVAAVEAAAEHLDETLAKVREKARYADNDRTLLEDARHYANRARLLRATIKTDIGMKKKIGEVSGTPLFSVDGISWYLSPGMAQQVYDKRQAKMAKRDQEKQMATSGRPKWA